MISLVYTLTPQSDQFHISNSAQFSSRIRSAETLAQLHYPHPNYRWAQLTADVSNMFEEIDRLAILDAVWWALDNVAKWSDSRMRRVDRFSVAKRGKAVRVDCDYTEGEMVTITVSQVMQVRKFDLAHSRVNVRHKLHKQGPLVGAPMGGMLSAFYAIICCSKREATAFTPRLRDLSMPVAVCRYMDDVYIAIAYVTNDQLTLATEVVRYIAAVGTGYPPPAH